MVAVSASAGALVGSYCTATHSVSAGTAMQRAWRALASSARRTCFNRFCRDVISFFWRLAKPLLSLHGVSPAMSA